MLNDFNVGIKANISTIFLILMHQKKNTIYKILFNCINLLYIEYLLCLTWLLNEVVRGELIMYALIIL